jgi:hypothetical protein
MQWRLRELGDAATSHMMALEIQVVGLSAICCALREKLHGSSLYAVILLRQVRRPRVRHHMVSV